MLKATDFIFREGEFKVFFIEMKNEDEKTKAIFEHDLLKDNQARLYILFKKENYEIYQGLNLYFFKNLPLVLRKKLLETASILFNKKEDLEKCSCLSQSMIGS